MSNYELAELAIADMKNIWSYFAQYSHDSANKFFREIAEKFQLLAENPKLGRSRDNYILGMRTFPHKDYLIFYFPIENGIEIYRVIHGKRDIDDLFDELIEGLKP